LKISSYIKVFFVGVVIHLVICLVAVSLDTGKFNFVCEESSCYFLLALDFPISFLNVMEGSRGISLFSPTIGSLWWGLIFMFIAKGIQLIKFKDK
jgi:hypothetical protein